MDVPPNNVIAAFGGDAAALAALDGGQGTSWRAGSLVLKPAGPRDELAWTALFVADLNLGDRLRVPRQLACWHGEYDCEGWAATEWLEGTPPTGRWNEKLAVSATFHVAASRSTVSWPRFMRDRCDPWSRATRVAWGEAPLPVMPSSEADLMDEMLAIASSAEPAPRLQLIHSDLGGNILFADEVGLPPAVIDISPQFRTPLYAEAILLADSVAWEGAPLSLLEQFVQDSPIRAAEIARAVIFRVATAALFDPVTSERVKGEADGYRRVASALGRP